jgi:phosphate transport system substrate-binding protein
MLTILLSQNIQIKNMKSIILAIALMASTTTALFAQRIKGSDTCLPLSQKIAEVFMRTNAGASVTVTGGGSGVGISALIEGTTEIAQSSRKITFAERQKMQEGGKTAKEVIAAYDALAIVVHPQNRVTNLTREQLEGIFTGRIRNWKDVGGDDMPIIPYARESSSGTYDFVKEYVLRNRNYMNGILSMPATGAIMQSVSQTRGAIGYVGLAYLNSSVKAIHVSYDQGKNYIAPTVANAKNETYPIVRPLYYYYATNLETTVKPFIDFLLSTEGQKIVEEIGFITVD